MSLVLDPLNPTTHSTPTSRPGKYIQAILNVSNAKLSINQLSVFRYTIIEYMDLLWSYNNNQIWSWGTTENINVTHRDPISQGEHQRLIDARLLYTQGQNQSFHLFHPTFMCFDTCWVMCHRKFLFMGNVSFSKRNICLMCHFYMGNVSKNIWVMCSCLAKHSQIKNWKLKRWKLKIKN